MSNITNDGLIRSGTGCFIAAPIWKHCERQRVNLRAIIILIYLLTYLYSFLGDIYTILLLKARCIVYSRGGTVCAVLSRRQVVDNSNPMIVSRKVVVTAVAGRGDRRNTNDMMTAWDP